MHLKGRLRRLLSSSSGAGGQPTTERSRRMSDVSENSDISYDRSSGSFVQRVTTSLRTRSGKLRRAASESAALESRGRESYDGGSFAYDESSTRPSPLRPAIPLLLSDQKEAPHSLSEFHGNVNTNATATDAEALGNAVNVVDVIEEEEGEGEEKEQEEEDGYPVPSTWGDEPSPEQLQQIQDRVSAWLDKSRTSPPSTSTLISGLRFPSTMDTNATALLEVPEETEEDEEDEDEDRDGSESEPLAIRKQPLRMLDSISEDEVPGFVGSSVSTAPSTPLPPLVLPPPPQSPFHTPLSRSRSQSPPLRRRSLEGGQDEYYMRGLDTIQEAAGDALLAPLPPSPRSLPNSFLPPSPRRSLDSVKRPTTLALESIPEIDLPPPRSAFASLSAGTGAGTGAAAAAAAAGKRRFGVKGFGFTRSESEPLMPTIRSVPFNPNISSSTSMSTSKAKRKAPPSLNVLIGGKAPGAGFRSTMPGMKEVRTKEGGVKDAGTLASPTLPSFQRGANVVMGQRSASVAHPLLTGGNGSADAGAGAGGLMSEVSRTPMNLRTHSPGSIAVLTEQIEDEESRRLTEVAFLG